MSEAVRDCLHEFIGTPDFLRRYPCYAAILGRMEPYEDPSVRVMAVSKNNRRFRLHINTDYFAAEPQYLLGVLLHEVHHVVLGHLTRSRFRGVAHPDLMTLAMEISANEYIKERLPEGAITWRQCGQVGLGPNQSTLHRYDRLVRARARNLRVTTVEGYLVDDHCSLPGGRPGRGEECSGFRNHGATSELDDADEQVLSARELLARLVEEAIEEVGDKGGLLAGREPRRLLEELRSTDEPPTRHVDWRMALRIFVSCMRTPIHTYARPSRRFPDRAGEIPGRVWSPVGPGRPRLLVAIDTSASMSREELEEVGRQLKLLRSLARITIVECDVEIARVYPFAGVLPGVIGRGGTDLRPVFEPAFLRPLRPDGIVYFTDGDGPYPRRDPGIPTLWVLTKANSDFPWGKTVPWGRGAPHAPLPASDVDLPGTK
jgi:predicted metal-dependent peptidase